MDFIRNKGGQGYPQAQNSQNKAYTGQNKGIPKEVWIEKDAKIGGLAFIKTLAEAGAYKEMTRDQMKEAMYEDYIFWKNREISKPAQPTQQIEPTEEDFEGQF